MNELLLQLNADRTYNLSSRRNEGEKNFLLLRVGDEEIAFSLEPFDAARIALALVELKTAPPLPRLVEPPKLLDETAPVLEGIRPAKRHTHRHCEVCNEPICKLVQAREPKA